MRVALITLMMLAAAPADAKRGRQPAEPPFDLGAVNAAEPAATGAPDRALLVRLGILLDRARVSPGVVDGRTGGNLDKAVRAFRREAGLPEGTAIDADLLGKLTAGDPEPALVEYTVTKDDAAGPWTKRIPPRLVEQGRLKRLGYANAAERLAERFHMDVRLLEKLNKGKDLGAPGTALTVARVATVADPTQAASIAAGKVPKPEAPKAARLVVDKREGSVAAFDAAGKRLAFYPATVGSSEKPAPSGMLQVVRAVPNPSYTYNPAYGFKGVRAKQKFEIAPGPNNPVGSVWIALDREGYGIHGTPDPTRIGKTASNGCVRLTNWSALELSAMVEKGVPVEFGE